jgi:murein L,D-transpeptidase YcbB/YkuD
MAGAFLPLALLAGGLLLASSGSASASASPPDAKKLPKAKPPGGLSSKPPTTSDALQAAQLAEKQLGNLMASQNLQVSQGVAQTASVKLPPGYDSQRAAQVAQRTADHVRTRGGKYDRAVITVFQTFAGVKTDGLYGPQTAAALRFFGAKSVPAALFKGQITKYTPPGG